MWAIRAVKFKNKYKKQELDTSFKQRLLPKRGSSPVCNVAILLPTLQRYQGGPCNFFIGSAENFSSKQIGDVTIYAGFYSQNCQ